MTGLWLHEWRTDKSKNMRYKGIHHVLLQSIKILLNVFDTYKVMENRES